MTDFIEDYKTLMMGSDSNPGLEGITDAPEEFHEAAALFLLSSAVGRKWIFCSIPEIPIFYEEDGADGGGRLLNLWFVIIGKTRITRKTTGVLNKAKELMNFLEIFTIPEAFSPQYLITVLNKRGAGKTQTHVAWIVDECSGFFEIIGKAEYMASAEAFMSRIYDGKTFRAGTISRGEEVVLNPYMTALLASTDYLPDLFNEKMFRQGFLNRFIFVPAERGKRKKLRTTALKDGERVKIEQLKEVLHAIYDSTKNLTFNMNGEAKNTYDQYEAWVEDRIEKEHLGIKEGYLGNLPNFVVRIACLHLISRMTADEITTYGRPFLLVEKPDIDWAIAYSRKIWEGLERVIEMKGATGSPKQVETLINYDKIVVKAFNDLLNNPALRKKYDIEEYVDEIPQNVLRKYTKITTETLVEILNTLASMRQGESRGGRRPRLWKLM